MASIESFLSHEIENEEIRRSMLFSLEEIMKTKKCDWFNSYNIVNVEYDDLNDRLILYNSSLIDDKKEAFPVEMVYEAVKKYKIPR